MLDVYNLGLGGIERERKHKVLAWMSELIGAIDSPARQGYPAIAAWPCVAGEIFYLVLVPAEFVVELVDDVDVTVASVEDALTSTGGVAGVFDALFATMSIDVSAWTSTFAASTSFSEASSSLFSCK